MIKSNFIFLKYPKIIHKFNHSGKGGLTNTFPLRMSDKFSANVLRTKLCERTICPPYNVHVLMLCNTAEPLLTYLPTRLSTHADYPKDS